VHIHIIQKNAQGDIALYWKVSPNVDFGEPRQLAYKLDTLIMGFAQDTCNIVPQSHLSKKVRLLGQPVGTILGL
jgi:hypothetical protein